MQSDKNLPETWTILKILSWTEGYFKSFGIDSPRLTAEILLCYALNIRRLDLYLQFDRPLNKDELAKYRDLIKRRVKREPVAYITGQKGFWDSQLIVNPDVLIPRADTERLVEYALDEISKKKIDSDSKIKVLELGVGSGAIAISLSKANSDAIFFATDISPKAIMVARQNSLNCSVDIFFLVGSWFEPIKLGVKFDIIISNPPYIPTNDIQSLEKDVREYEPLLALDGGDDGLCSLRHIMQSAPDYLKPNGLLIMEMGFDQRQMVEDEALKSNQYKAPFFIKDYAGHYRVVSLTMAT
ncbi:MAG: peptide chain release factor N(5)-glutamine methyltransferase [Desulfamplus sp.]|nr:peptide chain release factor N(5)-glutamine methyltransferase [Desulfamplus sp.]MBF0390081.1 peptide chain release factor N(5)-glutamine methyltransferase [Desulfamplus sp.]